MKKGDYYVYIVLCSKGTYYTGFTNDLGNRLKQHNSGNGAKYLRGKGPVKLVYTKQYAYSRNALYAERVESIKFTTDEAAFQRAAGLLYETRRGVYG